MHANISKNRVASCLLAAILVSAAHAGDFGGEVLTNSDVINLTRSGLGQEILLTKITTTPALFDTSSRAIMTLKESGVADAVIGAMMTSAGRTATRPIVDETRLRMELQNISSGDNAAKTSGLAWLAGNRDQTLPAVRRALADPSPEIRSAALVAVDSFADLESLPAVRNLLRDPALSVRQNAAQALFTLNDAPSIAAAETALASNVSPLDGYIRLLGRARLTRAAPALGQILSSGSESVNRVAAAWAIGEIGRPGVAARPALEHALTADAEPAVRREAAMAIAKYHDADSARLLEEACKRDYEVRKTTLAALAEYPEAIPFLVEVINLDPLMIAADEVETARSSLVRLTGQDFGVDGRLWSEWHRANAAPAPAVFAVPPQNPMPGIPLLQVDSRPVDVAAWNLVAGASDIPLAPENVSGGFSPIPAPGMPGGAPLPGAPAVPGALSPNEFDNFGLDMSSSMPPLPASPAGAGLEPSGESTAGLFRTWTSDPDKVDAPAQAERSRPRTAEDVVLGQFGSNFDDMRFDETTDAGIPGDIEGTTLRTATAEDLSAPFAEQPDDPFAAPQTVEAGAALAASPSVLPSAPIVTPMPTLDESPSDGGLRGISLPIPGMDDLMGGTDLEQTLTAPAESVFSQDDPFAASGMGDAVSGLENQNSTPPPAFGSDVVIGGGLGDGGAIIHGDGFGGAGVTDETGGWSEDDPFAAPAGDSSAEAFGDDAFGGNGFDQFSGEADSFAAPPADMFEATPDTEAATLFPSSTVVPSGIQEATPFDSAATPASAGVPLLTVPLPAAGGTTPAPPASASGDGFSPVFVEPAPGQEVIGEILAGPGVEYTADAAAPATPYEAAAATEGEWDGIIDAGGILDNGVDASAYPDSADPFAAPAESFYQDPTPEPAFGTGTPEDSYAEPVAEPTAEPAIPQPQVYPETNQVYTVPTPFADNPFMNSDAPLPPVKPEGTVTAPKGKENPPMLGENMF